MLSGYGYDRVVIVWIHEFGRWLDLDLDWVLFSASGKYITHIDMVSTYIPIKHVWAIQRKISSSFDRTLLKVKSSGE